MNQDKIIKLLETYLHGSCEPADLIKLNDWYETLGMSHKNSDPKITKTLDQLKKAGCDFEDHMYEGFIDRIASQSIKLNFRNSNFKYRSLNRRKNIRWIVFPVCFFIILLLILFILYSW